MHILLPIDGSELSLRAVHFAIQLAKEGLHAHVLLANVQEPANLYEIVKAHDPEVIEHISEEAGAHALQKAKDLLHGAGVPHHCEVVSGEPVKALLDLIELKRCTMVVMAGHGKSLLRTALEGSVSHDLLQASPVPVLIVKPALQE
jgi:nucleotide-binding universal stress UspA family protein